MTTNDFRVSAATHKHLDALLDIEQQSFDSDRLSRRSMRRFLANEQAIFLVAEQGQQCVGYLLVIFRRGTRLARLYSIAVGKQWRGQGVSRHLMNEGQEAARQCGAFYFRLEVNQGNVAAIQLYESLGFRKFGLLQDYYEDHGDALRMQKRIRYPDNTAVHTALPWFPQSTPFTCGPASLLMAMAGLSPKHRPSLSEKLQLWREATTIFMTSGHGGCHPLGLALAANKRGFNVQVWINHRQPLFVDGVRSEQKKLVVQLVHEEFVAQSEAAGIVIHYRDIDQPTLVAACAAGAVPIVLISTYRMDGKKAPHWVAVSGYDESCFYVHDPFADTNQNTQELLDCQYLPIAHKDFDPMSSFGGDRLRTAVVVSLP